MPTVYLTDPRNEDWLRTRHWDLPTDPEGFIAVALGSPDDPATLKRRWLEFQALPAFEAMPEGLRAAVEEIIARA